MTVRLRPHHLLCLLTYVGKGYDAAFVRNCDGVAARIGEGEAIEIVAGPDDICAPLACSRDRHCLEARVSERDRLAARDVGALLGRPIGPGVRLTLSPERLARMRAAFAEGSIRSGCAGCEWHALCTAVARAHYAGARLTPAAGRPAACS